MSAISPKNCKVYYRPETTFTEGGTGSWLPLDFTNQLTEDFEIGVPEKLEEMKNAIGRGKFPTVLIEGGYKAGEQSTSFDLLSGIFLKYALGADTVTTPETGQYIHTMSATDSALPSMEMAVIFPFSQADYKYKLQGIKVKSMEITAETGENTPVKGNVELIIAKIATTTETITDVSLSARRFTFKDVSATVTYNSEAICANSVINKFSLKVENKIEYKNQFGDDYAVRSLEGGRTLSISSDQMIRTSTIYSLAQTLYRNYATAITASFNLTRTATDYINISVSDLRLKPMKHKHPSWESMELMQELQFEQGTNCSVTVTARDTISSY